MWDPSKTERTGRLKNSIYIWNIKKLESTGFAKCFSGYKSNFYAADPLMKIYQLLVREIFSDT